MYERFTDRARKVMQLANQQAQKFNHEWIAPEHILLGLVKDRGGVAANAVERLGVGLATIEAAISEKMTHGPDMVTMGKLPQTPLAKNVVSFAMEEARDIGHGYVGTEHFLLGLLREDRSLAFVVLSELGLTLKAVRNETLKLLSEWIKPQSELGKRLCEAFTPSVLQQILDELKRTNELLAAMAKPEVGDAAS